MVDSALLRQLVVDLIQVAWHDQIWVGKEGGAGGAACERWQAERAAKACCSRTKVQQAGRGIRSPAKKNKQPTRQPSSQAARP